MKKAFIILLGVVAVLAANLSVKAQEATIATTPVKGDVLRTQISFITDGNWNDGGNWSTGVVPAPGSDVVIMANVVIPAGYTAVANEVNIEGGSITVADGGQLRHNTENLVVTMKKSIEPYCEINGIGNYYLLGFPFSENVDVPAIMTFAPGNDFYKFDSNSPGAEWRNSKQEAVATVGGTTGYLYANPDAIELSLTGKTYTSYHEETKTVTIPYSEDLTDLSNGWALLGNPYTCNAYIYYYNSDNELVPMDYMVYDTNGELMTLSGEPVAPMQGFFVKVTENTMVYIKSYADHEYVDLGLPSGTLWATCNVGAYAPEEYGDYFAWGETLPKETYNWSTYRYCNGEENALIKYCSNSDYGYNGFVDNLTYLLPEDDAATSNWGSNWRMPYWDEWQELIDNTTSVWTMQNGVYGRLFTAQNGNNLFLPAAGIYRDDLFLGAGIEADYWSRTLDEYPTYVLTFEFNSSLCGGDYDRRFYGFPVRPVRSGIPPMGAINGKFTVNEEGNQVYFSQGNLQYIIYYGTHYWKFAENQWDYLGNNGQISNNQYVNRDLFGWGTSGYAHGAVCWRPWSTSTNWSDYYAYGNWEYNLYDQNGQADWGYNPISNGGNQPNRWRTPTNTEWFYVFNTRTTNSGIRYAKANVNSVNGVILLPDDWSTSYYSLNNTNSSDASFSSNTITASQWNTLEQHGAVYLPAAGCRYGTSLPFIGDIGHYWSTSSLYPDAYELYFDDSSLLPQYNRGRYLGCSVRLVCDVE